MLHCVSCFACDTLWCTDDTISSLRLRLAFFSFWRKAGHERPAALPFVRAQDLEKSMALIFFAPFGRYSRLTSFTQLGRPQ